MSIAEFRASKNMTQSDLAEILNVSRTTVTMWENGKAEPNIKTLKKLAEVLSCTVDDLLDTKPEK